MLISTQGTTVLVLIALVLLFLSFCFSGAEVAFFSLNYKDVNYLKTKKNAAYRRVVQLLESPQLLQTSLSLANTVVNLGFVLIAFYLAFQHLPDLNTWAVVGIALLLCVILIITFGEVLPKLIAAQHNLRFARDVSLLTDIVFLLFNKPAAMLSFHGEKIMEKARARPSAGIEELTHAISLAGSTDQQRDDKQILQGIIGLGQTMVKQVMRTRLDVTGIPYDAPFGEVKAIIQSMHYSRFPVYGNSLDEIKGMLHSKDLLQALHEQDNFDWHGLMREAFFVHEQKPIESLMKEFQLKRIHFAIVVDEFGGTSGIVTLEDIVEEVIGEIDDEFDDEVSSNQKIDDLNYIFEGKTMLNDVCKQMKIDAEIFEPFRGESDSLAGLLLEVSGEIPAIGEEIAVGDFNFKVLEVERNRIQKVQVIIRGPEA